MSDATFVAAALLVVGPLVGALFLADPALFPVWSAPRERQLAIVAAHRRSWRLLNVGFVVATVLTASALAILATTAEADSSRRAALTLVAVSYGIAGVLWCAVLAIRARTTPALADMVSAGTPTEPAERLLGETLGGLFAAYVLATCAALVTLGLTLAFAGGVAAPVAWLATLVAGLALVGFLRTGDTIPAVLYLPTLFVGVALLVGWS
jgi:hypothetical protein